MTLGTRGDVQPFVALARALAAAGHDPVLCAPYRFADFVAEQGVAFAGVDDGPMRQLDSPSAAGAVVQGGVRARLRQVRSMPAMFAAVLNDCWRVASQGPGSGAEVVVHNGQILAGHHVAEALGVPAVLGLPLPMYVPTRAFPWPGQTLPTWFPSWANRATYHGMKLPAVMFRRVIDAWRRDTLGLGLRPGRHDPTVAADRSSAPVLHAYSPTILPRPADWPDSAEVTGYWFLPPTSELPEEVEVFLTGGPAPVFVGFGSMSGRDRIASTAAVVEAAAICGTRLVVATGWGGLDADVATSTAHRLGVDVLVVGNVDYQLLFPRVAAVVHHGGAGTTGTAFAAGRPQVICPFVADQPFWARLAHSRGVAPSPLPQTKLTADALAARLTDARQPTTTQTAADLGAQIRAEHGLDNAVAAIERAATTAR